MSRLLRITVSVTVPISDEASTEWKQAITEHARGVIVSAMIKDGRRVEDSYGDFETSYEEEGHP